MCEACATQSLESSHRDGSSESRLVYTAATGRPGKLTRILFFLVYDKLRHEEQTLRQRHKHDIPVDACRHVYRCVYGQCTEAFMGMRPNWLPGICTDIYIDMYADMCIAMREDACMDRYI